MFHGLAPPFRCLGCLVQAPLHLLEHIFVFPTGDAPKQTRVHCALIAHVEQSEDQYRCSVISFSTVVMRQIALLPVGQRYSSRLAL